jgi:thymidylate kinase
VASRVRGNRRLGALAVIVERWRRTGVMVYQRWLDRRDARPVEGGAIIALVGPKASGKSTLGGRLARTFGKHLDVRPVHVGKPPATWLTLLPRAAIPLARKVFPGERSGEYEKLERLAAGSFSLLYVLNMTMLAHDRRALLERCAGIAASGAIVVTDRFPSKTDGAIDGSRFDDASLAACPPGLKRWLMLRERALYLDLPEPDLVIRLQVPPALAVTRDKQRVKEGGPDAAAVLRRWEMETLGSFGNVPVVEIDTAVSVGESAVLVVKEAWAVI